MDKATFLRRMETLLEVSPNSFKEDTRLADVSEWDSLALLGFIAMADGEMNKQLETKDIITSQTMADLYNLLES